MATFLYSLLAFAAGVGIPVMAALQGTMGGKIGSPIVAVLLLFSVATMATALTLVLAGLPSGGIRWPPATVGYGAGLFAAFYMLSITFLAPRLGVANAVFLVILGQLATAAVVDHFGLFGAPQVSVSAKRTLGIALMAVGVFLARKPV